jgi:esterase/lipase
MKENAVYFPNSKGNKLFGVLTTSSAHLNKPIMLIVHGHSSNHKSKYLSKLSEELNKKNIPSFRIDLYGHGDSEGNFEDATVSKAVDSILSAVKYLKSQGYKEIGLVGSSYGGFASSLAAAQSKDICLLALKSPVSDYSDLYLWRGLSIEEWKKKGYREYETKTGMEKLNYSFYEDAVQKSAYDVASKIQIPVLIVHGDADTEVPVEQSIQLAKHIPHAEIVIIKGADHTYTNEKLGEEMLTAIRLFIEKNA